MNSSAAASASPPRSRTRRLLQPLVEPAFFDFWASRINPAWSWEQPRARIVARAPASADSVTLWLAPNRHCPRIEPGQHIMLGARIDGTSVTRSYSPTSLPGDRHVSITVKRVEGGKLSRHLCDVARVGDVLELGTGFGAMRVPTDPAVPCLLLAAGSGITPLMAMTRALAAQGTPMPLTLLYWCSQRGQFCFVDELRELAHRFPNFRVRFVLTQQAASSPDEAEGRIDAACLARLAGDCSASQVYACGGNGFVAAAESLLRSRSRSFQAEAFSAAARIDDDEGQVELTLTRSGRQLQVARGESLLTALEAAGLRPAHGCRMGICNTCACAKTSGSTQRLDGGAICDEPVSALKLCVNRAVGNLTLDL